MRKANVRFVIIHKNTVLGMTASFPYQKKIQIRPRPNSVPWGRVSSLAFEKLTELLCHQEYVVTLRPKL